MKFRKLAVAAVVVLTAPAFAQCSAEGTSSSGESGVVRYGSVEPSSMDPRKSGSLDAVFLTNVYDSLTDRTPAGKVGPGLATEWKFSEDGKTFDLTLREGVTFQDGEKFDAAAVKANIESAQQPGATRAGELEAIESIEIVDDLHVRLHLSHPATQLIGVLAGEAGMMISPTALDDPDLATQPVGAGPYELTKFNQGEMEYTAWDGYWDLDSVKNDKLVFVVNDDVNTQFRALKSGQLNFYSLPYKLVDAAKKAGLEVEPAQSSNIWQVILNTTVPQLAKPEVRKAISLALDRPAMTKGALGEMCKPTVQPFGEGFLGHADSLDAPAMKQDVAEARRLMAQAGYAKGFDITITSSQSTTQQDVSTIIQAQLKEIGISVDIEVIEQSQSTAKQRKGEFEMVMSVPPTGRPDPTAYVETFYAEDGLLNQGFKLDTVESNLLAAQVTTDEDERQQLLAEISESVYEAGAPTVPLCSSHLDFVHASNVSGVVPPRFNDWDFKSIVVK